MRWSDIQFDPPRRPCGNSPGFGCSSSGDMALWQFWCETYWAGSSLLSSPLTIGPLGLIRPDWMRFIYVGWMVLAFPIGWTVSQILLADLLRDLYSDRPRFPAARP